MKAETVQAFRESIAGVAPPPCPSPASGRGDPNDRTLRDPSMKSRVCPLSREAGEGWGGGFRPAASGAKHRERPLMPSYRAIGLMSGTSMDGVDVALVDTDAEGQLSFGPTGSLPYSDADRALLRGALAEGATLEDRAARPGVLAVAEKMVTDRHAEAVETFLAENAIDPASVSVVGFHGQTVLHRPKDRLSVQIGDGPALAERLRIDVVHDFRAADLAAGGQGAPIVPVFHRALVAAAGFKGPVALLNIGGVANVTYIEEGLRAHRLRHGSGQCAHRRSDAPAHRRAHRPAWANRRARPRQRGRAAAIAISSIF